MCDKKRIYDLFFIEKKRVVDIANLEGVSKQAISKILKQFPEFKQEKERRKAENKEKNKKWTNEYKKQKRQQLREQQMEEEEALLAGMRLLQAQSAAEMSKKRRITDEGIVTILIHHYDYDKDRKILKFNESCGSRPNDVPERFAVKV